MSAVLMPLPASTPMAVARPAPNKHRGRSQSAERAAVEAVLGTATRERPITVLEISARCAVPAAAVRVHVNNICNRSRAHNIEPGTRPAYYAGGPAPAAMMSPCEREADPKNYDGRELRAFDARPGAMDAFALPSLQGGVRVPRRAPTLICARVEVRR